MIRTRPARSNSVPDFALELPDPGDAIMAYSRFLIIDDFLGMRSMLAGVLRTCGAQPNQIDMAANAGEALTLLAKNHYDVVLCDYNLGVGKNGTQVMEEARQRGFVGHSCCWMMVSAEKSLETVIGTAESQPDAYIIKPVTEASLVARIKKIKHKKSIYIHIDQAIAAHHLERAIQLCDDAIQNNRIYAIDLLRLKCDLLIQTGQLDKARRTLLAVLSQREVPWAQLALAKLMHRTGEFEQAGSILESLLNHNRSYIEAYDCLSKNYESLNQNDKAEIILERALRISPKSRSRQQAMGELALKLGKFERAEAAFRQCVQLGEFSINKEPSAYLGLARTLSARGNTEEALSTLELMPQFFKGEDIALQAKAAEGLVCQENNDKQRAAEIGHELVGMVDKYKQHLTPETLSNVTELLLQCGEQDRAIQLLQMEVMNNPEDADTLERTREIFRKVGLTEQGDKMVEASRKEAMTMMDESVLLTHSGDYAHAAEKMRLALTRMPHNVRLLLNTAHVIITLMEHQGFQLMLAREARRHLLLVNTIRPGLARSKELLKRLDALRLSNSPMPESV